MDLHIIPVDEQANADKFIIFRPLAGLAFVGNRAMATLAQQVAQASHLADVWHQSSPQAWDFLAEIGFLEPDPPAPGDQATLFRPTMAVLLLTNQCQLRCTYCYAAAGEFPPETLTVQQGCAAIDIVCEQAQALRKTQFEISFHGGGEPTFVWQVLQECTAYARQKPLSARITLTSNGVWSPRQREWILEHIDGLTLSWDGTPETQDRQRPFTSGQGSASLIRANIAELDSHHFPYGMRMTATAPWAAFVEGVRFICAHTGCRSLQVEPSFNTQRGGHGVPAESDCLAFAEAFMAAWDIAQAAGRRLMYSGARLGTITPTFCLAPYDALIISPRGTLVACYEVTDPTHPLASLSAIGRLDDGVVTLNEAARHHLHTLMVERRQQCRDCFCYWSCAGDCYTRSLQNRPGGHLLRGPRCLLNQTITRQRLLQVIAEGQGVWRRNAAA